MFGKIMFGVLAAAVPMLFGAPPWAIPLAAALGAGLGHWFVDRDPAFARSDRPLSVDEIFAEEAPRIRLARQGLSPRPGLPHDTDPELQAVVMPDVHLAQLLAPLFMDLARADGAVAQVEVRVVREYFERTLHFSRDNMEHVRTALKSALARKPADLAATTQAARAAVKPPQRVELVHALYDMALADGDLQRSESEGLRTIVQQLNLSDEQLSQITREFFGDGQADYEALGLTATATDDELKSAFRKLAAENHPDRVASLGADAAAQATERFRAVKDAYERLRKLRGL